MPEFADVVILTRDRYEEMKADITESMKLIKRLENTNKKLVRDLRLKLNNKRGEGEKND